MDELRVDKVGEPAPATAAGIDACELLVVILPAMTTMTDLTPTQREILALIVERIETEGMPPSQTEIARAFGFKGVRAAQYHLEALEAAGAIEKIPGRARGLRVLRAPEPPQ